MTERGPNNIPQHDAGAKLDADKVRPDLILSGMPRALLAVAEVATFGARKYTENGWMSVPDGVKRYTAAMDRHRLASDERDEQSGLLHAAHLAWNALARLELMLREPVEAEDDGPHFRYRSVHVDDYQQIARMKLGGWRAHRPVNAHGFQVYALELKAPAQRYRTITIPVTATGRADELLRDGWEPDPDTGPNPSYRSFRKLEQAK